MLEVGGGDERGRRDRIHLEGQLPLEALLLFSLFLSLPDVGCKLLLLDLLLEQTQQNSLFKTHKQTHTHTERGRGMEGVGMSITL